MRTIVAASSLALVLASLSLPVAAQTASGQSLLDPAREAQLERWLGQGDLIFNPLFTGVPGNTSLEFHRAVDGKGRTFTLLQVSNPNGQSFLVGGYNPQSWSSTDGWHVTIPDSQRTAFLFNMTAPAVYRQVPSTYILPSQGSHQTFNAADHGPTFGVGPDLFVNDKLNTAFSWQVTYGDPKDEGKSIIDRSVGGKLFHIDALQLFAVSPIPEPGAAAMLLAGLALVGVAQRRRSQVN